MAAISAITMSNVGKLLAEKGGIKVFERIVPATRYNDSYRILTSFKDGKPFKQVVSGKPLTINERFYSVFKPVHWNACWDESKKNLRSIPNKVRDMWNNVLNDMGCFNEYGHIKDCSIPNGHKTIIKNFETGETTTIVKAKSFPDYKYNEHIKLYSAKTKQKGKVVKEFGQVAVKADEGVCMDKSIRTYIRNQDNPNGTVTLESSLRGSRFDSDGLGGFGHPFKEQRGWLPGRSYYIKNNTVSVSAPADEYNPALHYISYHV